MTEEIDFFQVARLLPPATKKETLQGTDTLLPIRPSFAGSAESSKGLVTLDLEVARKALETPVMQELISRAEQFTISDTDDASEALTMQDQALVFSKQIEKTRKEIVRPHLAFQKAVKKFGDDLKSQFDAVRSVMQAKLEAYGQQEGAKETGIPLKIENDDATAYEETVWLHSVEDPASIPPQYMMINEQEIKTAIKDGVRTIPGLKIYSETRTKYRSKPKKTEKKA